MSADQNLHIKQTADLAITSVDFGLKDAIALKHTYVDQSHKFWAYFQLAAAAATGFAWQTGNRPHGFYISLALGFAAFALANNRLVVDAQSAAYKVSLAIDAVLADGASTSNQKLKDIANLRKPDKPSEVRLLHAVLSAVAVLLILIRMPSI
jgi:hypothetical protein